MSVQSKSSYPHADVARVLLALAVGLGLLTASWAALHLPPFDSYQIIDTPVYQDYGERMAAGEVPYRDFELEYPPGALPVFWLPTIGPAEHYRSIFEILMWTCAAALLALVVRAVADRGASPGRVLAAAVLVGLFPLLLGSVVLTRYDLWPAALTAAALAALLSGRERLALAVLGLAVAAKIYPLVLLPPALVYIWRRYGSREAVAAAGAFVAVLALVVAPFALIAPEGLADSLSRQLGRPLQIESLGSGLLLALHHTLGLSLEWASGSGSQNLTGRPAAVLAVGQGLAQAVALVLVWVGFARGPATTERLLRFSAAALVAFVALSKVLSPQFLVWLVLLVPLVGGIRSRAALWLTVLACALTAVWFPARYWELVREFDPLASWLVLVRGLTLVALLLVLTATEREPARSRSRAPSPGRT